MLEEALRSIITAEVNKSVKRHLAELGVAAPEKSVCHDQSRLAPLKLSTRTRARMPWSVDEQRTVNDNMQFVAKSEAKRTGRSPESIKWRWLKDLTWELSGELRVI